MRIILDPDSVNELLAQEGLEVGWRPIEAFLLQRKGTASGNSAVMLLVQLPDGTKALAKTTLRLMEMAVTAARIRSGPHIDTAFDLVHKTEEQS
jgi:hypothetical protein